MENETKMAVVMFHVCIFKSFVPLLYLYQLRRNKDELPLLAGDYILGYYNKNMQSLVGLSPTFQVGSIIHYTYMKRKRCIQSW